MSQDKAGRTLDDYFEFVVRDPQSKLVTSFFKRGRRITLRGIGAFVQVHKGKPTIGYEYPCIGPLMKLVAKNESANDFTFNTKTRKWKITR